MSRPASAMQRQLGQPGVAISYRDYSMALLAGVPRRIAVDGDYWQVQTASADVTMEFNGGNKITRQQGTGGPMSYTEVTVTSAVNQNVVLSLGQTGGLAPYDGRSSVTGTVTANIPVPQSATGAADLVINAGATGDIPANAARFGVIVSLDDGAPGPVRVGSMAAGAGAKLYPGVALPVECAGALRIRNDQAVQVTVSYTEITTP